MFLSYDLDHPTVLPVVGRSTYRSASTDTEPAIKAAELHQELLKLRMDLSSLHTERQELKRKLEATIL